MEIYGVSVVQNEADVIGESLKWALRFCRRIWVWDLGSEDETWSILSSFSPDRVIASQRGGIPFTSSLKGRVCAEARSEIPADSWIYILDADEFLEGDLEHVLALADRHNQDRVGVWQANFYPTRTDIQSLNACGEAAWAAQPLCERLRHFRLEWYEWRFVRARPELEWDTRGPHSVWRGLRSQTSPFRGPHLFVRHYRYRSPQQVAHRHHTRRISPPPSYGQFRYEISAQFEDFVRAERHLVHWPPGTTWHVPLLELLRARWFLCLWKLRRKWQTRRKH